MDVPILLRPHHGLCIPRFVGRGYSEDFVLKMKSLVHFLEVKPSSSIKLTCLNDVLCKACTHLGNQECLQGKIFLLDKKCLDICHIAQNTIMPWNEYLGIISKKIPTVDMVCDNNCRWISICKKIDIQNSKIKDFIKKL